jgi:hypothetical protein
MRYQVRKHVARPPAEVFDFVGTNVYTNHPKWEREVLEIRPMTAGPARLGSRAVMVRKDFGRVFETEYEVTAFVPDRTIAFRHTTGPMLFELEFALESAGSGTDLTSTVQMQPRGAMRLMSPLIRLRMRSTSERLTAAMVRLVEAQATSTRSLEAEQPPGVVAAG